MAADFEAVGQATAAERVRPSQHLQILLQTVHPAPHTAASDDCLSAQPEIRRHRHARRLVKSP